MTREEEQIEYPELWDEDDWDQLERGEDWVEEEWVDYGPPLWETMLTEMETRQQEYLAEIGDGIYAITQLSGFISLDEYRELRKSYK